MLRFARLFDAIDRTTSTNAKVAAMAEYFTSTPPADAIWSGICKAKVGFLDARMWPR